MEVVTMNPIEMVFFPWDDIVPQVHISRRDGAVKVAMSDRLGEGILQVQKAESCIFSTCSLHFTRWTKGRTCWCSPSSFTPFILFSYASLLIGLHFSLGNWAVVQVQGSHSCGAFNKMDFVVFSLPAITRKAFVLFVQDLAGPLRAPSFWGAKAAL